MNDNNENSASSYIAGCSDPKKLEQIAINARAKQMDLVERAAQLRLYAVLPAAKPGTFEHDVWQSIHALEGTLKLERDKTVRLARTREKIKRFDEYRVIADLMATAKPSEGYHMLIARDMPERTFEAVVLRHPDRFDAAATATASARLAETGIDAARWVTHTP